jgi:rod shape-determining protein MreC
MSYHLTSSRGKKSKWRFFLWIVCVLVVLFLLDIFSLWPFNKIIQYVATPFFKSHNIVSDNVSRIGSYFSSKVSLEEENKQLKERAELTTIEALNARTLVQENNELKELLGRKVPGLHTLLAVVLLKPSFTPYDTLVVDVGTDMGVSVGNVVMVAGSPIGTVVEVYPHSSLVRMYSSSGQEFHVLIGQKNIAALAYGRGGGSFMVSLPKDAEVKEGDMVTIPSIQTRTVAVVHTVSFEEGDTFKTVYFRSPININELKWVEVVPTHE